MHAARYCCGLRLRPSCRLQEPDAFQPERFLAGTPEAAAAPKHGFMPFGDGARACIGLRRDPAQRRRHACMWASIITASTYTSPHLQTGAWAHLGCRARVHCQERAGFSERARLELRTFWLSVSCKGSTRAAQLHGLDLSCAAELAWRFWQSYGTACKHHA